MTQLNSFIRGRAKLPMRINERQKGKVLKAPQLIFLEVHVQ